MTKNKEIYKCSICGNIVEVLHEGAGELVCCGQPMDLLKEIEEDNGQEKHVPVVEREGDTVVVKVGSVAHPMEENHFIEWIELVTDKKVFRKHLAPGEESKAVFCIGDQKVVKARSYCNVHGLWQGK